MGMLPQNEDTKDLRSPDVFCEVMETESASLSDWDEDGKMLKEIKEEANGRVPSPIKPDGKKKRAHFS